MDSGWSADEDPVVGVVDRGTDGTEAVAVDDVLESVLADAGGTAVDGSLEDVLSAEPSVLVTTGEGTLSAVACADVDTPVLPVGPVSGIESVDRDRLPDALEAVLDGRAVRRTRSVLGVTLESDPADDGESSGAPVRERALFDVTLITDEPARISEYRVRSRDRAVATFRADGVVAATPAGSHGYASAVDAPHLSAAVDALAVAPIGPFVTQTRQWVLPNDGLAFTVEREDCTVTLVIDGRSVGTVTVDSRVDVSLAGALPTLVVPDEQR